MNLIEDTGLTETVNLGEDINLSGDTGPSEGTELSENTNTTEDSELIIEGEESEANPLETEGEESEANPLETEGEESEANPTETEGEEAIEETFQTEMEDPIDDTELLEGTETTENLQPEETLPKDITNCMDQLTLSMKKWWYEDQENTVDVTEEKYVDFSEFIQDPDEPVWAGVSLKYEAVGFQEGDWFTVVLPEQFEDVQIEEGFVFPEGMEGSLKELEEPEQGTELTMRFSTVEETFDGELPLQFRLSALEDVSILLQEDADRQNEYVVIPPFAETEQEGMVGVFSLRSGKAETNTFSIKGEIVFDENLGGTDWRSILRPLEFDQNIKLIATYQDASEVDHTVEYYAQDSAPQDAFYLMMTHDGEGGGSFEIINVPKKVTLENGFNAEVTKYNVSVDTQYPYYENENGGFDVTDMGATQTVSTLRLKVKSQNLTLDPNVVGDQTPATFPMDVTFTKSSGAVTEQSTLSKTVNPTNIASTTIQVPVGIDFSVVQNLIEGYKLDLQYTVTTQTEGSEPVSNIQNGNATGTIVEGTNVTVTTKNYMQNLTYPLSVTWVDNNNSGRPVLGESSFKLQYKTESGEWTDLTEASKETLGIDNLPTFDASNAALGKYVYRGLPSIDAEGNSLSYQVVPFDLPGYTVSADATNSKFTYRQTTTFNATISWMDSDNADNKRPDALPLNLYRRAANGSYELVSEDVPVNKNSDNTWSVSVSDLPRYNDSNQEYDYVLVQGTIGENNTVTQTTIDSYKTFYDNGTGNYGNDIALCHNGGTISQRISGVVDFSATKKWKDNVSTTEERPETTVTLWRYSVPKDGDHSIDTMYNSGLAAQVIYRKTTTDASGNPTYQDVLLSYQLNKQDGERITFDQNTVHDLPDGFKLPAYDEQGRKYVYFVRETVDSEYYETSYTSNVGVTFAQGAPNGGTITNTRREKSAVNITKVWQCPSNLPDIEGVSVQMKILAPDQDDNYEELTVYSAKLNSFDKLTGDEKTEAQTLSGFAESIATLDLQFYVNIYDENGLPYDMTKAVIQEIKVLDKNKNEIDVSYSGEANLGTGMFTLEGNQYTAASTYINQTVLADGMKQFQYKETNTISGERNYTLIKKWQGFEASELDNYASVSFSLKRRSSKDGASYEQVNTPAGETTWLVTKEAGWQSVLNNLPKYDNQGYEYLYSAEEVAVKDTNGNTVTQNWSSYHYRTEDSTTVTNYRGTGGSGAFYITKEWMDNGDTEARKAVTVRIYRKSDVLNALQEKQDEEVVDLNSLNIGYASCQLSSENNWFCEIALSAVENEITQKGGSSVQSTPGVGDYLILEYQVGGESDGAHPASYTVSQLKSAIESESVYTYNISGTVSNSQRQYETLVNRAANGMLVTITNIRIGQASLEVTKNWFDENNVGGIRPNSLQFQVYQDGQVYMPGVNSGIGQISGDGATWDPATGIITVSRIANANTESNWSLRLENLPLFSETGVPHTYNVEEIEDTQQGTGGKNQNGGSSYYLSEKGDITVTSHDSIPDRVTYGFSFDNTLTGTMVHSVHKTWNDIDSGGFDRPDLYLTLYRYLRSDEQNNPTTSVEALDSYEKYSDCEDPIWTVDNAYHWRAEVTGLPRYDDQGREYVYRFQEALNNNGVTVYGTYVQTAEYLVKECDTCKGLGISYAAPYDKFTNTLTDNMTVSGVKTWKGFEGYEIEQKDYPTVTIELYRSLNPNINPLNKKDTDEEFKQWISDSTIEKVTEVVLRYDAENNSYPTTYSFGTESNPLPKFNGEGRRWYYSIREVFPDTITNSLYTENFDNGTLTNVFLKNGNRRTIQVMKTWNRGKLLENEKDKYPSVTYYLYRYEEGVSPENAALLKSIQVSANDVAANANWAATGEGQEKPPLCEFKDLLIYSPFGKPYYYYVTEKAISGYSISYSDEAGIGEGYSGNRRSDVISIPENPFTQESDHTVKVGTTNTYDNPGLLNISGKKYWNDYGNSDLIYGKRPDSIEVTLKRYTQNESGQANMVSEETIELLSVETQGKPYILWEKSVNGDNNYWQYTIHNLERYAPNGMPYIYSVTETPVDGYKQFNGAVSGSVGTTGDLSLAVLTNSLGTTYYVRKNWMDGNNKYGLRPTSITVVLQRSNDGGNTWRNIPWESSFGTYDETAKKWTGLPSVTTDESGKKIVSIKLTADYVMNNTKGNSWQYTFTNLPEKDKDGKNWTYRCIETKIDNAAVEEKNNIFKAGAYTCTYPIQDDAKTVIQNKLESTSLHVTKNWEGDQNDLYHSRPDSITFVLQMRGIVQTDTPSVSPESGGTSGESGGTSGESGGTSGEPGGSEGNFDLSDWQNVKVNGQDYTFTISKAENWRKTLQDLPVAIVGEDGRTYYTLYFRAVEKHVDDTVDANGNTILGNKVSGAQNYEDKTNYNLESSDHSYNSTLSRNESKITNQLILDEPAKNISITKNWKRQSGESVTATFELLYKTVEEGENSWHCFGNQSISGTWTGHTAAKGCVLQTDTSTGTCTNTLTWSDLPKYDREGKKLVYKVVEHPIAGYKIEYDEKAYTYTFTNIELQNYTVKKKWQNTDYAEKEGSGFTATFQLQQKIADGEWNDVEGKTCTLISITANDKNQSYTWAALPKYTTDGTIITYRAVETKINGVGVDANNTNGSYIVSYQYNNGTVLQYDPAFAGTETVATNRMVYGFVNLSKAAAYLAPGVTPDGSKKLKNVVFDIYSGTGTSKTLYASGIQTDENGNLIRNDDGTYGTKHKYLISGTYTLMERSTNPGYSVWKDGVTFTVGVNGPEDSTNKDTGEHGTAWISTSGSENSVLSLSTEYKSSGQSYHTFGNTENCTPKTNSGDAYNLETRGVIEFTKTGPNGEALDIHAGASGESKAYFGVYTDATCNKQIAGMMSDSTGTKMVLTTLDKDGTDKETKFCGIMNTAGIPYLRKSTDNLLTLLSGTYYLKELVAPPGYKLDGTVRKAIVPEIQQNNGSNTYANNKAGIMLIGESSGSTEYQWANTENQVTLYKRDQYGRHVDLGENGYLELKVEGEGNKFLTGENTIRLYQNAAKPATMADGSAFAAGSAPKISYDSATGSWTIKGLFDIGKTYTLSEPVTSVPVNNIHAKDFSFTIGADGKITVTSTDAVNKENPLEVAGDDYENYYKSDSGNNVVVLRDVVRYLTDVALKKVNKVTNVSIPNISFELYKMIGTDEEGNEMYTSVLENDKFLTTDSNGVIKLSDTSGYMNLITSCDLKYGLDVGMYYFQEIERGASDIYRLMDKIYFEIKPKDPGTNPGSYEDYATVEFQDTGDGSVSQTSGEHSATVKNTPVTENTKTLQLTKVDSINSAEKLSGAQFTLTYTSITNGQNGAQTQQTYNCKTDTDGVLYLCNDTGTFDNPKVQPDISRKGTYVLVETQAPDYYMTRTPEIKVTFKVNSQNEIKDVVCSDPLISAMVVTETGEHKALELTVKNEKTVVSIAKRNDIENNTKTSNQKSLNGEPLSGATLEIYEGMYNKDASPAQIPVKSWTSDAAGNWNVDPGTLKENTIYTLHESQAPVGYLPAKDIYFKLFGTTTKDSKVVSKLYVWTGSETPTLNGSNWSESSSIKDTMLTMVDEAIIAPVDLQKVVGEGETYKALPGAEFEVKSLDGDIVLGTAVSDSNGHLVWKTVTNPNQLVFNSSRKRITDSEEDKSSVIEKTIILRQNSDGYLFTETDAPDHAYNKGESFTVKITDQNYMDYRDGGYRTDVYVDILAASSANGNTVSELTARENTPASTDLVNPPYKSTVTLHKYDADEEANNVSIPGTEFTLYHASESGGTWTKGDVVTDAFVAGESTPNLSGVFTTDAYGNLSIEIHNKGYYILEETKAATGYELSNELSNVSFQFQLIDDTTQPYGYNTITQLEKTNNGVPNERKKGTVTLMKKDSGTQEALNGVVFTLTRTDSPTGISDYLLKTPLEVTTGIVYEPVKDSGTWTWKESAGTSGEIKVTGLNWGDYKLKEKTEKSGYIRSDTEYSFKVKADERTFSYDVSNKKNQVTFYKTDDAVSKGLAGAVFEVHEGDTCSGSCTAISFYSSVSETTIVNSVVSGDDGRVTIYGLPTDTANENSKTYHLVETTAPKGYKLAPPVSFTIDRSGKVQVNASDVSEVQMKDEPIKLYIKKIGEDSSVTLAGAQFQLTDICTGSCDHKLANGGDSETVTTEAGGNVMIPIERVIAGHTYQLEETKAPDGYECTAVVTFKVKEDGTAELLSTSGGHTAAELDSNKTTFTISNEKIQVSLTKVDYEDPTKKLGGVTFTLKPAEGSGFVEGYTESIESDGTVKLTTDANGTVRIPLELMKHDNSYILTETGLGSNSSYRLAEHEADRQITFKVEKGGTITITNPNDMFQLDQDENGVINAAALIVSNQKITLTVDKQNQATGQKLKDVTLKLSKQDTNGNWNPVSLSGITDADGQWTTDDTGAVTFKGDNFTPGTYKLEEVSTPEGYNLIAGPLTFIIDQSGKVTEAAVGNDSLAGLAGNSWNAKNFTITNPADGKPGEITLNVSNAAYTDLKIIKEGSDGVLLNDVEFRLDYWDGTQWQYVNLDNNGKAVVTNHVLTSGGIENAKRTTDTNGIVIFSGLPNGKYRLTELKTSQGYNLLSAPLEIEIDRNGEIYKVSYNGGTELNLTRESGTNTISLTVINQKGFVLPATGTTTPQLPKAVLGWIALMEGLVLYQYQLRGKRRKRKG
ncbi:SpaA isopeptide-forming pilin-related protein [Blautia sp. Sow4_E7]|uniref:SpaA isopeptide-forming pilin-related protein n=1 Tax=Blautia sp. Sow4_E7 TaxID=3438749 RepID=UPI003F92F30B